MKSRARARLTGLFIAVVTLISSLLLAEGIFRGLGPRGPEFVLDATLGFYDPDLYVQDETLITRLAPRAEVWIRNIEYETRVRTNALGLRGPAMDERVDKEVRVLAIGDSFTLGVQVEEQESFLYHLEQGLEYELMRPVTVYNAGVDGYGTQQAVGWMERLLRDVDPDAVVLTFYLGNDLRDNARLPERLMQLAQGGPPVQEIAPVDPAKLAFQSKLARHSRLYAWFLMHRALRSLATDFRIQEYADEMRPFADASYLAELLPATERTLLGFASTCNRWNLFCAVALAPPAYTVHSERTASTFEAFDLDPSLVTIDEPARRVTEIMPDSLQVVDLRPALVEEARFEPMYFTFDPHWTPQAHAIAGKTLAEALAMPIERSVR